MKNFYWKTLGHGNINLIILNGWGFDSNIWLLISQKLSMYFKVHLIDFPGIGVNKKLRPVNIQSIIQILNFYMPKNSIYLGWSLGGLIAIQFALSYPKKILGLINICSSPYFIKKNNWPGIEKKKIYHFYHDLKNNYFSTLNNFLSLHTLDSEKYLNDLTILKKILFQKKNIPNQEILKNGLKMILSVDLRHKISQIKIPFLRIYGDLDNLVPKEVVKLIDIICPNSESIIIEKSRHIPFISHKKNFFSILFKYFNKII
ncbi:Pimeloyl-[acyl-carrier protein] methyl ester esterase [Buchnera aphidicola (Protaphis terricola)]|uniref:pimeloyl-ACP methyl ester esterase BioH n=1 Tax=Buchnera aphidicola TaxID=9 RepID=UPI0034643F10